MKLTGESKKGDCLFWGVRGVRQYGIDLLDTFE